MASLFGLGFLKGAATSGLDRLEKRDEAERELRKEKLLQQVRLETQKDLADYEDLLNSKKVSKDLSSPDYGSGKYNMRNSKGEDIGSRDLTQSEIDDYNRSNEKEKLGLDKIRGEIEDRQVDNARQERLTNAQIGSYNASADSSRASAEATRKAARGLDGATGGQNESGSYNVGSEIMRANEKTVQDVISDGIPGEEVAKLAAASAANAKARGQGYNEATQYFLEGLRMLRSGASRDSDFNSDAAGATINERRAELGLQNWRK